MPGTPAIGEGRRRKTKVKQDNLDHSKPSNSVEGSKVFNKFGEGRSNNADPKHLDGIDESPVEQKRPTHSLHIRLPSLPNEGENLDTISDSGEAGGRLFSDRYKTRELHSGIKGKLNFKK